MQIREVITGLVRAVRTGDASQIDALLERFAELALFDDAMTLHSALIADLSRDGAQHPGRVPGLEREY